MAVHLTDLELDVRRESNTERNTAFVTPPEVYGYVNDAVSELHDLMTESFQAYSISSVDFSLSSTAEYDLAANVPTFYKEFGVYLMNVGPRPLPIHRVDSLVSRAPALNFAGDYRMYFVPDVPLLTVGTPSTAAVDLPTEMERWKEFIVNLAAQRVMRKRQKDTGELAQREAVLRKRIEDAAPNRTSEPTKIPMWRANALGPARRYCISGSTLVIVDDLESPNEGGFPFLGAFGASF